MLKSLSLLTLSATLPLTALAAESADKGKAPGEAVGFGYLSYGFTDPTTLIAFAGLVTFLLFVWWVGGFKIIANALDKRSDDIRSQLEEARKLREEATRTLAEAKAKAAEADAMAEEIVMRAKADADAMMKTAKADLKAKVERREAQAEQRIARAEADAVNDVRRVAADAATQAAKAILSGSGEADNLFDKALKDISERLN